MLENIAKYMCIIRVNYNAKELKLVTTQPQKNGSRKKSYWERRNYMTI